MLHVYILSSYFHIFNLFFLFPFFQSTLQIWLQMHWVSTRFLMPYSPSLFFSSYSFGIALFEHGVPYALIPFLQFSLPNFLANALGAWGSTYPLFPFYILVIVRFNLKEKPQKKTKKTRPKNNPPKKKHSKSSMPGCKSCRQKREHWKLNFLVNLSQKTAILSLFGA